MNERTGLVVIMIATMMLHAPLRVAAEEPSCESQLQTCEGLRFLAESRLEECVDLVGQLSSEVTELSALRDAYARLAADTDGDGEPDVDDACPGTADSLVVDDAGCSLGQFCRRAAVTNDRERARCRRLDWSNDEPDRASPHDCRFVEGSCRNAVPEPEHGGVCASVVTLKLSFEIEEPQGVTAFLQYDPALVSLPGHAFEVQPRVENVTGQDGLFLAADSDVDGDTVDEQVGVGLIAPFSRTVPAGSFARISFDCADGAARAPEVGDFACTAESSTDTGWEVPTVCTVSVDSTK